MKKTAFKLTALVLVMLLVGALFGYTAFALTDEEELTQLEKAYNDAYDALQEAKTKKDNADTARKTASQKYTEAEEAYLEAYNAMNDASAALNAADSSGDPEGYAALQQQLSDAADREQICDIAKGEAKITWDNAEADYTAKQLAYNDATLTFENAQRSYQKKLEEMSEAPPSSRSTASVDLEGEDISLIYPSTTPGTQSVSSSGSEDESGTVTSAALTGTDLSGNRGTKGKWLIAVGIIMIVLALGAFGFFVYSMFIAPNLQRQPKGRISRRSDPAEKNSVLPDDDDNYTDISAYSEKPKNSHDEWDDYFSKK